MSAPAPIQHYGESENYPHGYAIIDEREFGYVMHHLGELEETVRRIVPSNMECREIQHMLGRFARINQWLGGSR